MRTAGQAGEGDVASGGRDERVAAGRFSPWLVSVQGAIRGEHGSEVPCGECTACCTSSHFIRIESDEGDTLAHIPEALRFPAPGRPPGDMLMGYDQRGHCPMLVDNKCSIYDHRPRVCRSFDCRIFAASGIEVDELDEGIGREPGSGSSSCRPTPITPSTRLSDWPAPSSTNREVSFGGWPCRRGRSSDPPSRSLCIPSSSIATQPRK